MVLVSMYRRRYTIVTGTEVDSMTRVLEFDRWIEELEIRWLYEKEDMVLSSLFKFSLKALMGYAQARFKAPDPTLTA